MLKVIRLLRDALLKVVNPAATGGAGVDDKADRVFELFNQGVTSSLEAGESRRAGRQAQAEQLDRSALTSFDNALHIDPNHVPALSGKAMTSALLGNTPEAVVLFRRALELEPGNWENLRQLGLCLIELGNITEAREATLRAVGMTPDREYARNAAIEVYNFGGHIMTMAAGHRDAGRPQDELAAYKRASLVFSLAFELDPSFDEAKRALDFVASLLTR
jgi:tetratricopeptide (TPR) repeat protein